MNIFISDAVKQAIVDVSKQAQGYLEHEMGVHYSVNDLEKTFVSWLESSIEQLADDALYHCIEGDGSFAFNRHSFNSALEKLTAAHTPAEVDGVVA